MRLRSISRKNYLYYLEIEDIYIRHSGDLNWYSMAVDAVNAHISSQSAVEKYCSGELGGAPYTQPRVELLVSQARVVTRVSKNS